MSEVVAPEHFVLARLPAQPWKNGVGLTREIATEPAGAAIDAFGWRISVAEATQDAPFSAFPGVDRCIVLLDGAGLHLRSDDGALDHALDTPDRPFRFSGDTALSARVLGGPTTDFNVMVRRGHWRAEVRPVDTASVVLRADATLLLGRRGAWTVQGAALAAGEVLLWREPVGSLRVQPEDVGTSLLCVSLWREPS